jgi:hypothetical protein
MAEVPSPRYQQKAPNPSCTNMYLSRGSHVLDTPSQGSPSTGNLGDVRRASGVC